jgi:hypothetical protein
MADFPQTGLSSAPRVARAVDDLMARLDQPFNAEIEAIRATILGVAISIAEGIKWNTPSSRKGEYFATVYLREKTRVAVILHLGAQARDTSGAEEITPVGRAARTPSMVADGNPGALLEVA